MTSCGICFVHRKGNQSGAGPTTETEYIAPDLLPDKTGVADQLSGRWNETEPSWRLEWTYPFLHPGLARSLVCDLGTHAGEAGVYWKYGAWVYERDTGCRAQVEQTMLDERRGRLLVRIQGQRHERLVKWLRERIRQRNREFGYPDLAPEIDELVGRTGHVHENTAGPRVVATAAHEGAEARGAVAPAAAPEFAALPATAFPRHSQRVFVSYAWGDGTPEGIRRGKVVDDLCAALERQGIHVTRDKNEMQPGDRISAFMDRLVEGDRILVVLSDKYLRSEYCMYELFRIYQRSGQDDARFLHKVIPLVLPDAQLDTVASRFERAVYWLDEDSRLATLYASRLPALGDVAFRKYTLIRDFARHTSNMLEYLVDVLMPRDFDRMAADGFHEIVTLLRPRP